MASVQEVNLSTSSSLILLINQLNSSQPTSITASELAAPAKATVIISLLPRCQELLMLSADETQNIKGGRSSAHPSATSDPGRGPRS